MTKVFINDEEVELRDFTNGEVCKSEEVSFFNFVTRELGNKEYNFETEEQLYTILDDLVIEYDEEKATEEEDSDFIRRNGIHAYYGVSEKDF